GALWVATAGALARLSGVLPVNVDRRPQPILVGLVLDGHEQRIRDGGSISFTPQSGRAAVEIRLGVSGESSPMRRELRFRLDGHDADWIDARGRAVARYPNLAPGRYRFRLEARPREGDWSSSETTLDLLIHPRFFETLWFRLLVAAALVLASVVVYVWLTA